MIGLLLGLLAVYALACLVGWPQGGRDQIVATQRAEALHEEVANRAHQPAEAAQNFEGGDAAAVPPAAADDHPPHPAAPPPATTLPFAILLAAIAIFPLTPGISHWWEHNRNKLLVAGFLAAITLGYYTFLHHQPVDLHFPAHAVVPPAEGWSQMEPKRLLLGAKARLEAVRTRHWARERDEHRRERGQRARQGLWLRRQDGVGDLLLRRIHGGRRATASVRATRLT